MSAKNTKKSAPKQTSNKKPQENQPSEKAIDNKKELKAPTPLLKASTAVTADEVKPLDPSIAVIGAQKPQPAAKKVRGPDKVPRKKRIDFNPEPEPELEQVPALVEVQPVAVVDIMAAARVNTTAFVGTFDILFCGWCPPHLTKADEKLLIDLWTPIVYENNNQIPAWVPAGLITLGIMGSRLIKKFS